MTSKTNRLIVLIIFCLIFLFPKLGMSLILVGGDEPIKDRGWPSGSAEMANLATRFAWWEGPPFGGGEYHFLYRCEHTSQFDQALEKFAARSVDSNSKKPVPMAKKTMPAPRVDVYLGGGNPIIWKDVKVPENLVVIDRRPGSVAPQFAGKGLVRGKVFDLETKQPIAGAKIVLLKRVEIIESSTGQSKEPHSRSYEWKKVKHVTTNRKGLCQIDQIPLGLYEVSVAAEGYAPVELERYDNTRAECYEFQAGLLRPFSITGIVTDTKGTPLQEVGVQANDFIGPDGNEYRHEGDSPVLTDGQGRFEIPDLPKGFASVRCRAEGLHQADSIFQMYPIPSKEIRLTMSDTGIIRGKVVDKDGKAPSGRVHVHIRPPGEQIGKWGGSSRCKEDGSFEFTGVPPGEYLVGTDSRLLIEGDRTNAKLVSVQGGKTYDIEIVHVEQGRRR